MPTEKNAAFLPTQYSFKLDRQRVKVHTTIALHIVFNGCETCLTRREEHRLRVFEIRVLRMIFGAKRER